jgi:hypothetical protein
MSEQTQPNDPSNNYYPWSEEDKAALKTDATLKGHQHMLELAVEKDAAGDRRGAQALRRIIGD